MFDKKAKTVKKKIKNKSQIVVSIYQEGEKTSA
jgi:hypothetical protein